jgi:signal peptidase I
LSQGGKLSSLAGNSFVELVLIVAVALGLALGIQAFLVKPYRIPSESMEPTLDVGQRVLVSRFNYKLSDPDRGDVVVFHPPVGAESNECGAPHPDDQACPRPVKKRDNVNFIKRIVAIPGDTVSVREGYAVVNGKEQRPGYLHPCSPGTCNFPRPIKVPPGHFFMMGDNRGASDDSRFWGPVPEDWIIGQAFSTYWPPKRIGIL